MKKYALKLAFLSFLLFSFCSDPILAKEHTWSGDQQTDLQNKNNWNPKSTPKKDDTAIFTNSLKLWGWWTWSPKQNLILKGKELGVGTFLFKNASNFNFSITDESTLTFYGTGVKNDATGIQTFNFEKSSLNFQGTSSADSWTVEKTNHKSTIYNINTGSKVNFNQQSKANKAEFSLTNKSELEFKESSSGDLAKVWLADSTLTINQDNTLGSLNIDKTSTLNLNNYSLQVGLDNTIVNLNGTLKGDSNSKLIKKGSENLLMQGDAKDVTILIEDGSLILTGKTSIRALENSKTTDLNNFELELGLNDANSSLNGSLLGNSDSQLKKVGSGTLNLGADCSQFQGTLLMDNGYLALEKDSSLGSLNTHPSSHMNVKEFSVQIGTNNQDSTLSGTIEGQKEATIIKKGTGSLNLEGDYNQFQGCIKVDEGSLIIKKHTKLRALETGDSKQTDLNNFELEIGRNDANSSLNGSLHENSNSQLKKVGSGTLNLRADCSQFPGTLLIDNGYLTLEKDCSLGSLNTHPSSHMNVKEFSVQIGTNNQDSTLSGTIEGQKEATIIKKGTGSLNLEGDYNQFQGCIKVDRGALLLKNSDSAELHVNEDNIQFSSQMNGKKVTLNVSKDAQLQLRSEDKSELCFSNSTLYVKQKNTIGSLNTDKTVTLELAGSTLELGRNNQDNTLQGQISGNVSSQLLKVGTGTLNLSGDSSGFHGLVSINEGTVALIHQGAGEMSISSNEVLFSENEGAKPMRFQLSKGALEIQNPQSSDSARLILKNSVLKVLHNNELGTLNTDSNTTLDLGESTLKLGGNQKDNTLSGQLIGGLSSNLIKKGEGILTLEGEASSFEGIVNVNEGTLKLTQTAPKKINVNNSKIILADKCQGHEANVNLKNSTLSLSNAKLITIESLAGDTKSHLYLHDSKLQVHNNHSVEFSGKIHGKNASQFIKEGNGRLELNGDNSNFSGSLVVNQGNLVLNSHLGGDVVVNENSKLSGTGSVNHLTINKGGVIAPGNSIGTLNVRGNYEQFAESNYFVQINEKGKCTSIDVKEKVELKGGTVNVSAKDGFAIGTHYTILKAEKGINGTFSQVLFDKNLVSNDLIKPKLIYDVDPKKVSLIFKTNFSGVANSNNRKKVAEKLDDITKPNDEQTSFINKLLSIPHDEIRDALDLMSGEQYANLILANQRSTQQFMRRLFNPVRNASFSEECNQLCCNEFKVWTDIGGGKSFQKGGKKANGYEMQNFNVTLGAHRSMNDWFMESGWLQFVPSKCLSGWTVGAAVSYDHQSLDFNLGGDSTLHTTQGALYALVTGEWYYAFMNVILGYNTGKLNRPLKFGEIDYAAHSKPKIFQAAASYEFGLNEIYYCNTCIQPFGSIETGHYNFSNIKESGAHPVNLKVKSQNLNLTNSRLGLHITSVSDIDSSWEFALDLAWNHLFKFHNRLKESFEFGEKFSVKGPKPGLNGLEAAFTIFKNIDNYMQVYADVMGERWKNYSNFDLSLGLSINW
jgi:fibronectin-binding autotransporter adhesin